jgi:hypothetical protein
MQLKVDSTLCVTLLVHSSASEGVRGALGASMPARREFSPPLLSMVSLEAARATDTA